MATQDYGIDGVLKTRLGQHSAYQVKFRTGRPALTWRELSTFMGLADSPNIHSRILLTNCDDLPASATVKAAQSFVSDGPEGVGTHLLNVGDDVRSLTSNSEMSQSLVTSSPTNKFQTFHVNGTMPTARREHAMRDFRAAPLAVMSNARCLTEGVDVPAVDRVAFLSPRRSLVDIVQATGRAMRRLPGKTTGYVLVPLYVELAAGETVEAAVSRTDFDEIWDVLHSLQEQDDVLAELIRYVAEQKGREKGFDNSRFAGRIDFGGPHRELETLRTAVTTRCLENLYSSWEVWHGKLKAFKERFGHCNVETGC